MEENKKSILKKWWVWAIAVVVVLGIIGSGEPTESTSSNNSQVNSGKVTNDNIDKKEEPKEEVKDIYSVGEEVKLNDNILVVNSVEKSAGDEWDTPKEGNEYIIVTVTIRNDGKSEISYNPYDFDMQNSKGQVTEQAFTIINTDTALSSGELVSGGEVSGTIVFEQPVGDPGLVLKYKANMFSDKEVKIKID